ncbi:MAG: hypothetical protein JW956_13470 [Calditrichaceae bacterium]|nr:hypothetical protein [Calditrichaceae bacterium]
MSDFIETHTADEIIDKAWTFVPKGIPKDKHELKNFKYGLDHAIKKDGISDSARARIKEGYDYIEKWQKRYFIGSGKLLIISILATFWYIYQIYQRYQQGLPMLDFEEASDYSVFYTIYAFLFLFGVIGYYWSQRAPAWLIIANDLKKGHDILEDWEENMSSANRPVSYNEYYDKSGRKVGDDQMAAEGTDVLVKSILWVVKILIMWIAIPIVSLVGFLRYYVFYM